jgi:hypothetical protein
LGPRTDIAPRRRRARRPALILVAVLLIGARAPATVAAGQSATRVVSTPGTLVPIPAAVPHQEGAMIDSRIVPDLRWIADRFPIYVTEGYSGPLPDGERVGCRSCHVRRSDHYNGLAVDIVPPSRSPRCDASWRGVTRLAHWAEPRQNRPAAPFRWVGYNRDSGHGCGNHLHLSWEHAPAPRFQLAEWVEVFPAGAGATPPAGSEETPPAAKPKPHRARRRAHRRARHRERRRRAAPTGGVSRPRSGGLSPRGD